ncbi:hypothetical protein GEMRC1_010261 [Eukaryota sp. GEM-RC1]
MHTDNHEFKNLLIKYNSDLELFCLVLEQSSITLSTFTQVSLSLSAKINEGLVHFFAQKQQWDTCYRCLSRSYSFCKTTKNKFYLSHRLLHSDPKFDWMEIPDDLKNEDYIQRLKKMMTADLNSGEVELNNDEDQDIQNDGDQDQECQVIEEPPSRRYCSTLSGRLITSPKKKGDLLGKRV